jgi:membrane associated rhomboid family serine protease
MIIGLVKVILYLAGNGDHFLMLVIDKLAVKSSFLGLAQQPWSIITYMFVHENFMHILFNMLILFWTGKIFCEFLGSRKIVVTYILGGISGALLYILAYNIFPVFSNAVELSKLIGASAGVIAVLVAIATLAPDYTIHLILFGPVRLKYVALFLVLLYLISIPDGNAGGNISHLGGAIFGFIYTSLLKKGSDIGLWLENLIDFIMKLFQPSQRIKIIHKSPFSNSKDGTKPSQPRQEVIDSILDKISRSGYSSLSKEEKETLFKASKKQGKE